MGELVVRRRRVAITGGARGIGLATAKELHARGATVVIGDIDGELAAQEASEIGGDTLGIPLDVADDDSFARFLESATADGPLDVLINNAGICPLGRLVDQSSTSLRRALEVNVLGCVNGMSLALPAMLERGEGHIINVASSAGKSYIPGGIVYCASKSAVASTTESARIEYAGSGVAFTCVLPYFTDTELIAGTTVPKAFPVVQPTDVARAIADAIETRKKDVYVPKKLGPLLLIMPLLGRRLRDLIGRRLGAYDVLLNTDRAQRSAYDDRIKNS